MPILYKQNCSIIMHRQPIINTELNIYRKLCFQEKKSINLLRWQIHNKLFVCILNCSVCTHSLYTGMLYNPIQSKQMLVWGLNFENFFPTVKWTERTRVHDRNAVALGFTFVRPSSQVLMLNRFKSVSLLDHFKGPHAEIPILKSDNVQESDFSDTEVYLENVYYYSV